MSHFLLLAAAATVLPPTDAPVTKSAAFKFPQLTTPTVPPAPQPLPGAVPLLAGDVLYVIPSDEPFLLFASPAGLVNVTRETGPLRIRARFLDGTGKVETRTIVAKHIAIVEPVEGAKGRVELIAVPAGTTDEKSAVRQLIDVNHGGQPPPDKEIIPGPKPVPPPVPPDPKPTPVITGDLWVILVEEVSERTLVTAKIVSDVAFWQRMSAAKVHFRVYDKDEPAAISKGYVKVASTVGLPALLVLDKDGDVVKAVPRPKDTAAIEALLKEVRP